MVSQGFQLLTEGEYKKALSKFDKAVKEDPENPEAHYGRAEAGMLLPKVSSEDIHSAFNKAIELDPRNAFYLASYGAFCIEEGRFNDAEKAYNQAAEMDPDNAPNYYSEFAVEYYRRAPEIHEDLMDEEGMKVIRRKALQYLLKAVGMDMDQAKEILC